MKAYLISAEKTILRPLSWVRGGHFPSAACALYHPKSDPRPVPPVAQWKQGRSIRPAKRAHLLQALQLRQTTSSILKRSELVQPSYPRIKCASRGAMNCTRVGANVRK